MSASAQIIEAAWLSRPSPEVAPDLLGCWVVRQLPNGQLVRGLIVETEAYAPDDPACHAYRRKTQRNAVMFGPPGFAYIYRIYGIYHCFNVVTDVDGRASAVLIRALALPGQPMRAAAGPGKLCLALELETSLSGIPLTAASELWLEHRLETEALDLIQTTRIGLSQGVEIPWRWYIKAHPAVSKF
ncbi:DNA-3-methyladenine glycosylase [Leptolyngbya sp. FACHB-261]|uniref:DNA-3-methyladenine glycosylase n=1 Tax=Leptolyngbya sp. FACHB-261 TaxID=2692806 RepID=UPI0016832650|nr:DNA-3-methyladenine glycosylase [Leptolyngbya sp. FACHB-261]MBD2103752.1 DNA-3-methyladenine glycosylase [Leptolyngbya sp. FACHB-261]